MAGSGAAANNATSSDSAINAYGDAMVNVVEATGAATTAWSAEMDKQARVDPSTVSRDELLGYVRSALDRATKLHAAAAAATIAIRDVLPPEACSNAHQLIFESLQLTERGSLEAVQYYQAARSDQPLLESANELLARADRAKVQAETAARRDGCALFQ